MNNENNERRKITYDKKNIKGEKQFIHDLLKNFSSKDEFVFYNNQKIYTKEFNTIFKKYQLEEINDIELDF